MWFIKPIKHATNMEWGICEECKLLPNTGMLCGGCLARRSEYFHCQVETVKASPEYRFRNWLSKLLKPEIRFQ